MKSAVLTLVSVFALVLVAGCVSQQGAAITPPQFGITDVSMNKESIFNNQSAELFVTIKSMDDRNLSAALNLSASRPSDAKYITFEPKNVDFGIMKKGEEVKKSITIRGIVAAGERVSYKFRIDLIVGNATAGSKELQFEVVREEIGG